MVFVSRKSSGFRILRRIYDKSVWYKIKVLYKEFMQYNPMLGLFLPPVGVFLTVFGTVTYNLKCQEVTPKYNETIVILRPDDPRVKNICKTDNMKIKFNPLMPLTYTSSV